MSASPVFRVFCDSNDRGGNGALWLHLARSVKDLEAIGAEPRDGPHVWLVMPDEFEVEGILRFDNELNFWVGDADWATIQYLDHPINELRDE